MKDSGSWWLRNPETGAIRSFHSDNAGHEWIVDKHPGFTFIGPSGYLAFCDLAIVTRDGSVPVVVATERDDNPGISVTNGAEQLAAQILTQLLPERIGEKQPIRLVEHYRPGVFDATMMEVRFAHWRLDRTGKAPRIGDALEWKALDARVAAVLAAQTHRHREHPQEIEPPKRTRGMGR